MRDAATQAALVGLALAFCPLAALVTTREAAIPVARARALMDFERSLGLFVELDLHLWLQRHEWLLTLAGSFYVWAHVSVLVGLLAFNWFADPARFRRLRDWLLATQVIVVAGYLVVPTAPPRLLPEAGFRDTLTQLWGTDATALAHTVQSPYAAMPSGHVAFAVIVAAGLWATSRRPWIRAAALAYPLVVCFVVLTTANHFWLDAVAGALAALVGWGAAAAVRAVPRGPEAVALRGLASGRRQVRARPTGGPAPASQPGC